MLAFIGVDRKFRPSTVSCEREDKTFVKMYITYIS